MIETEADVPPRLGPRGVAALRASRPWALLVGIIAFVLAALGVVDAFVFSLVGLPDLSARGELHAASLVTGFATLSALIGVVICGLSGWFALQYGRRVKSGLDEASPQQLEAALWWQRRYWTLQGILMVVLIVVAVLVFAAAIIVAPHIAAQDVAWVK